jgi:hypothetical protein
LGIAAFLAVTAAVVFLVYHPGGPQPGDPPGNGSTARSSVAGDNAVSQAALVGTWVCDDGWGTGYIWHFMADGRFMRFVAGGTTWKSAGGTNWDSAWNGIKRGNYRVNGHIIECYGCQSSTGFQMVGDVSNVPLNMAMNDLFNSPMKDPDAVDDFTVEFEFNDSMSLRIAVMAAGFDKYDYNFSYYSAESHDVEIPAHSVPSREWPIEMLAYEIPLYDYDCRIREIETGKTKEITIYIDRTTQDDYANYVHRLVRDGWENDYGDEDTEERLASGEGTIFLYKGGHTDQYYLYNNTWIGLSITRDGYISIAAGRKQS